MTMKTRVTNTTKAVIVLKEGNAGAFKKLTELQPEGKPHATFEITVDTNATYRVYWCAVPAELRVPGSEDIIVTSDDCIDNKEIRIVQRDGQFKTDLIPRKNSSLLARIFTMFHSSGPPANSVEGNPNGPPSTTSDEHVQ